MKLEHAQVLGKFEKKNHGFPSKFLRSVANLENLLKTPISILLPWISVISFADEGEDKFAKYILEIRTFLIAEYVCEKNSRVFPAMVLRNLANFAKLNKLCCYAQFARFAKVDVSMLLISQNLC